ncbi:MAG TPA: DUF2177 family protein [bacterium]|nr:DUF2177 family protein [bacterium]
MQTVKLYLAMFLAFLVVDMIWLGVVARTFYKKHIGYLLTPNPNWTAAFLFYLLFVAGVMVFVVQPGLAAGSLKITLLRAALFGLVTYATYDLTNLATVRDWPVIVTVVDLIWGTCLSTLVGLAGYGAGRWLSS